MATPSEKTKFTIVRAGSNYILIERPSPTDPGLMDEAWLRTDKEFKAGDSIEITTSKVKKIRWT